jgi:hypothetical protein
MATLASDVSRSDQRTNVRVNPFWIKSAEITLAMMNAATTNKIHGLFRFPAALGTFFIHEVWCQIVTGFDGTTPTIDIGLYTLDAPATDLTYTVVDTDEYIASGEITSATPGWYPGVATDFSVAKITTPAAALLIITGADTVQPCITADLLCAAHDNTTGSARIHILVSMLQ